MNDTQFLRFFLNIRLALPSVKSSNVEDIKILSHIHSTTTTTTTNILIFKFVDCRIIWFLVKIVFCMLSFNFFMSHIKINFFIIFEGVGGVLLNTNTRH